MYYLFREVDRGSDGTVIVVWNSLTPQSEDYTSVDLLICVFCLVEVLVI